MNPNLLLEFSFWLIISKFTKGMSIIYIYVLKQQILVNLKHARVNKWIVNINDKLQEFQFSINISYLLEPPTVFKIHLIEILLIFIYIFSYLWNKKFTYYNWLHVSPTLTLVTFHLSNSAIRKSKIPLTKVCKKATLQRMSVLKLFTFSFEPFDISLEFDFALKTSDVPYRYPQVLQIPTDGGILFQNKIV